jgi:predicted phosphoribosyltransferase
VEDIMERRFHDRSDAGRELARRLAHYGGRTDVVVLALPRGGVPVAFEVAQALHAPLDVFLVRKLGFPGQEELAMGAIASGGVQVLNHALVKQVPRAALEHEIAQEESELVRREQAYRAEQAPVPLAGKVAILVDDGLATGASMRAAIQALHQHRPQRIVVAVPIAAPDTCEELAKEVDEIVCARMPEPLHAVGLWYEDFAQTEDDEVYDLLRRAHDQAGKHTPYNEKRKGDAHGTA